MKVTFVLGAHETIGVEYVSSYIRQAGIQTAGVYDPELFSDLLFVNRPLGRLLSRRAKTAREALATDPDVIAFSAVTPNLPWALDITARIKAVRDVPIVFGGVHPSAVPEQLMKNETVDVAVVGEGEEAMVDLVNGLANGGREGLAGVPNLWTRQNGAVVGNPVRPLIEDLDSLPYPDKDLFYRHVNGYSHCYKLITARGCPHQCTFCYHSWWRKLYQGKGTYLRQRSVDSVLDELTQAVDRYDTKIVRFNDEDLWLNRDWFLEFAERYRAEINRPFWCYTHPASVDEERVLAAKRAGCYRVEMGVQSIRRPTQKTLGRTESLDQIRTAIRLIRDQDIVLATDALFYVPGQSLDELEDLAAFYNDNPVDIAQNAALHYFPAIPIIETAKQHGILTDDDDRAINENPAETMVLYSHFVQDKTTERLRTYTALLVLLPRRVNRFILDRRLWRFLPILHPILVFGVVSAFRAPKDDHWYERRHQDRYKAFVWEWVRDRLPLLRRRRHRSSDEGR